MDLPVDVNRRNERPMFHIFSWLVSYRFLENLFSSVLNGFRSIRAWNSFDCFPLCQNRVPEEVEHQFAQSITPADGWREVPGVPRATEERQDVPPDREDGGGDE